MGLKDMHTIFARFFALYGGLRVLIHDLNSTAGRKQHQVSGKSRVGF